MARSSVDVLEVREHPGWVSASATPTPARCAIFLREQEVRLLYEDGVCLKDERLLEAAGSQTRFPRVRQRNNPLAAAIGRTSMPPWRSGCSAIAALLLTLSDGQAFCHLASGLTASSASKVTGLLSVRLGHPG